MTGASSRSTTEDIQEAGYTAYLGGKTQRDNPYTWSKDRALVEAWNAGFAAARTDRKKANRLKQQEQR